MVGKTIGVILILDKANHIPLIVQLDRTRISVEPVEKGVIPVKINKQE